MGVHESNGSLARASGMIARFRKATTEWTAHLREGYSERLRKQAVLAGPPSSDKCESVREETTGQANTAEPARDVPFIPDFQLLRRIGQGSYGEVWLARNIVGTYRAGSAVFACPVASSRTLSHLSDEGGPAKTACLRSLSE